MAITTMDGLLAAMTGSGQRDHAIYKSMPTPGLAGIILSLWNVAGMPGAAATPAAGINGELLTDATAGAFPFTNPAGGVDTYLGGLSASATVTGTLHLYDRLWQNNFPNATTTGAQAISPSALTRHTDGHGVEAWFQVYVATGAGAPTVTILYTDQDGNTAQTGTVQGYAASAIATRTFPISLAAGDTGVRAITSYTQTVSMSSGTIGLVLRRRLATLVLANSNVGATIDAIQGGLETVEDDACLELLWQGNTAAVGNLWGALDLIQG
jgi:hypothetical protein